jgi:hypothetical protein
MKIKWPILIIITLSVLAVSAAKSIRVPTRTPPLPPGMVEASLPSKKAQQAKLLREAAEAMEEQARRDVEALGTTISNRLSLIEFSSDKFTVQLRGVSFMEVGTGLVMQVRFDYAEK